MRQGGWVSRWAAYGALGVLALPALPGCGDDTNGAGAGNGSGDLATITFANAHSAANLVPIQVGVEAGLYEECGMEVQLTDFAGGGELLRAATTGAVDIAAPASSAVIPAFVEDAPVSVFAGAFQGSNASGWIAPADSEIESLADLEGASVGITSPGSTTEQFIHWALPQFDISPEDVTLVPVGGYAEGIAAMASGAVDVTWTAHPWLAQMDESEYKVIFDVDEQLAEQGESYQQTFYVANSAWARDNPDLVETFSECTQQAYDHLAENPDEAAQTYAELADVSAEQATAIIDHNVDYWTLDVSEAGVKFVLESLQAFDALPQDFSFDDLEDLWTDTVTFS